MARKFNADGTECIDLTSESASTLVNEIPKPNIFTFMTREKVKKATVLIRIVKCDNKKAWYNNIAERKGTMNAEIYSNSRIAACASLIAKGWQYCIEESDYVIINGEDIRPKPI